MKTIEISSKDNEKIKNLKKLSKKKYRRKFGKFVVENLAIVYDALQSRIQPETLFLSRELFENQNSKLKNILDKLNLENIFIINEGINKHLSSLDTPSGIFAVYDKSKNIELDFHKEIVYLNGIKDPGNLGTIFRSALAFGIKNIVVDEFCADPYNPKTIQAAKDSIFKINLVFDKDRKILKEIKEKMKVFVTDVDDGKNISNILNDNKKFCLVLGSESHGVSDDIKEMSDGAVNIKSSSEIESLNVSVSAGIIFYEIYNR